MIGYIPARGGSKRIPRKNIRNLGDKPIIAHTIATLLATPSIDQVFVSTDDTEIAEISQGAGAQWLGPRSEDLANDSAGFIDLMHADVPRHCDAAGGDTDVLFALATAALLQPEMLEQAIGTWRESDADILMSVTPYDKSPYWALVPDDDGYLNPLFPEMVKINSQDLPPAYTDAGLFYVFEEGRMKKFGSHKDVDRLLPYEVSPDYGIDIDTPEDWENLERIFESYTTVKS